MDHEELTPEEAFDLDEIMRLIDNEPEQTTPAPEHTAVDAPASVESDTEKSAETNPKHRQTNAQKSIVMYLHDLVYLMAAIVLAFLLFFRIVVVSGDSMYNTLVDGDYLLLLSNVFYTDIQQGDIIVASKQSYDNGTPIVKRVIATEGQTVDIDFSAGIVYVDGVALEEDYIYTPTKMQEGIQFPLTVAEGCVFVLGDNRAVSKDSRNPEIGLIDTRQIVGKAILLMFPGNDGWDGRDFGRIGVIG